MTASCSGYMVRCSAMRTLAIDELLVSKEVAIGFVHGALAWPLGIQAFATAQSTMTVSADVLVPKPMNVSTFGEGLMRRAGAVGPSLSLPSSESDSPGFRMRGDTALAHGLGTQAYQRETLLQDLVQLVLMRLRAG